MGARGRQPLTGHRAPPAKPRWSIYLVRCRDGTLYTGIATDVSRRFAEHERDRTRGAKYLRGRGPLHLVLRKAIGSRGHALRVEQKVKRLSKTRKERLIRQSVLLDQTIRAVRRKT